MTFSSKRKTSASSPPALVLAQSLNWNVPIVSSFTSIRPEAALRNVLSSCGTTSAPAAVAHASRSTQRPPWLQTVPAAVQEISAPAWLRIAGQPATWGSMQSAEVMVYL